MASTGQHAVVLGGSIAGLLASRVLSEHFDQVTLVERDALSHVHGHRKGVPQSLHVHSLMSSGSDALDRMFPGLMVALRARGALIGDVGHARYAIGGRRLPRVSTGMRALRLSRPLLEGYLRERVRALPNVAFLDGCEVRGLIGTAEAIRGVRIVRRDRIALRAEELAAELVVDATGRGSKLAGWLEALGVPQPREERVRVDLTYHSCVYRGTPATLGGALGMVVGNTPDNPRSGVAMLMEGGQLLVTLACIGKHSVRDHLGMVEFAQRLAVPDLYDVVRKSEPLSMPIAARFPHSLRRRYELLKRPPAGVLAIGDALCSFSPIYAQGMSVAALEAELLDRCLRQHGRRKLPRAYYAGAARIIETPWRMAASAGRLQRHSPLPARLIGAYMARLMSAASGDARVTAAFLRVAQLQKPASSLFAPALIARVLCAPQRRSEPGGAEFDARPGFAIRTNNATSSG